MDRRSSVRGPPVGGSDTSRHHRSDPGEWLSDPRGQGRYRRETVESRHDRRSRVALKVRSSRPTGSTGFPPREIIAAGCSPSTRESRGLGPPVCLGRSRGACRAGERHAGPVTSAGAHLALLRYGNPARSQSLSQVRGLTAFATADQNGELAAIVLALHVADARSPSDWPRLSCPDWRRRWEKPSLIRDRRRVGTGRLWNRPRDGSARATLLFGWGPSAARRPTSPPGQSTQSAGTSIRAFWGHAPPINSGRVWPERLGNPLLADAPRSPGSAGMKRISRVTLVSWSGCGVVMRFLERVPLERFQ